MTQRETLIDVPAILLVGGLGTRLKDLTSAVPKALVPVADRAFLEWQVAWLAAAGCRRVHLAAGHLAHRLQKWIDSTPYSSTLEISMSIEPEPLGTGGGLQFAASGLGADRFLVVNGDTLLPRMDLAAFLTEGESLGCPAYLAVTHMENAARFGTVRFDEAHRATGFLEKGSEAAGWVNGGVYLLEKTVLDGLTAEKRWSLEVDGFPVLVSDRKLGCVEVPSPLLDMGTPAGITRMQDYLEAHPI